MSAEQLAVLKVESVALVAGRVIFRRVERIKAMPFGLDLGTFSEGKTHPAQDGNGFVENVSERVKPSLGKRPRREGRIDGCKSGGVLGGN